MCYFLENAARTRLRDGDVLKIRSDFQLIFSDCVQVSKLLSTFRTFKKFIM